MFIPIVIAPMRVIFVVPVSLRAPAMLIFVPPAMPARPAVLSRLAQLMPGMLCLPALVPVMFNGFMQMVISAGNTVLTIVVRAQTGGSDEEQETCHGYGGGPAPK
jgi:hypothetical protein